MKIFNFVVEVPKLAGPGGSAGGWKVLGIIQTVAEEQVDIRFLLKSQNKEPYQVSVYFFKS